MTTFRVKLTIDCELTALVEAETAEQAEAIAFSNYSLVESCGDLAGAGSLWQHVREVTTEHYGREEG